MGVDETMGVFDTPEPVRDMDPPRSKWLLLCNNPVAAARYAAEQDWWLHSWQWIYCRSDVVLVYEKVVRVVAHDRTS